MAHREVLRHWIKSESDDAGAGAGAETGDGELCAGPPVPG